MLTSCKVDAHLGVEVGENGSGVVRARFLLDDEAVEALGGALPERLRVADLEQAGWDVDVDALDDGGAEAVAEKEFARPEELPAVVDQLSGEEGPLRDFTLTRHRSLFETDFRFSGQVDLEAGLGSSLVDPDDEGVLAELSAAGLTVDELREFLGERVDPAFNVEVVVDLPGDGGHNAPGEAGGEPRWEPRPGSLTPLRAESSERDIDRLVLVGLGVILAAAALRSFLLSRRSPRGERQRATGDRAAPE